MRTNYPVRHRTLALAEAYIVLVKTLLDTGALDGERFLVNASSCSNRLIKIGETTAGNALRDLVEPIANDLGFHSETLDRQPRGRR